MVTLGTVCTTGTFYEMNHGTAAAQRDVYRTWWFALILATLGTNIFCAMMKRYPWKKHHTGVVMAHIGILTLLAGSLVSLHFVLEAPFARQDSWLAAADPARSRIDFGPAAFAFLLAREGQDVAARARGAPGKNSLSFVLAPGGRLLYGLTTARGQVSQGEV